MAATVATGLIAGMFFAFSFSVMPGLARVDDRTFVVAMQENIEATLDSAAFMGTFSVAPLLLVAAAVVHYRLGFHTATWWISAALALYVIAFGVTVAVHQPLNQEIVEAGSPSRDELASVRSDFEDPWNSAHTARTIAATLALACLSLAGATRNRSRVAGSPSPSAILATTGRGAGDIRVDS